MSLKIDRVQLEIIVQQDSARQKMLELEQRMRDANKELGRIKKQFGANSEEYKAQQVVIRNLKIEYDKLFEEIGLGNLSMKELGNRQRELNAILRNLNPNTKEWREYRDQLDAVNLRIKEVKGTADQAKFSIGKLADGFNRYAAVGASVIASLTGVALTARKCVDEFAEMQEAESQVRKYTGMTTEEVALLNEEFKRLDTRTARTRLNELAGDAGKLGISGKKDVMEFVDAANMINVALGEDLGEDAVKNIGKLAQMFGEDKTMGLRGAMLATGSAVNEVAQNSSAAEAYLVAFTARVAGAANQAKVAQGNIIGYASVLDQNMQQQEMAATAFQNLMMKMYQEPAKFAKMAGQNVADFTKLIKTDANEAILQLLDTLNKKGGLDKLAPIFKEMGLDGVRASGVISTMAGKVDDIRKAQTLANKAYADGTSIINEYNVQNTTVQAELEKAKKRFADVRIELGEQLMPVMRNVISGGSLTVKALSAIISITLEYKGAIIAAAATVAAYTVVTKAAAFYETTLKNAKLASLVVQKAKVLWDKTELAGTLALSAAKYLLTGKIHLAKEAMIAFNTATKANLLGLIASLATAAVTAFILLRKKTDEVNVSLQTNQRIAEKIKEDYGSQEAKVNRLVYAINNENASLKTRRKYLEELKSIIPGYNAMINDEGKLINNNTDAIKLYLQQLEKQIRLKAAEEELEELLKRKRAGEIGKKVYQAQLNNVYEDMEAAGYGKVAENLQTNPDLKIAEGPAKLLKYTEKYDKITEKIKKRDEELKQISSTVERLNSEIASSSAAIITDDNKGGGGGGGTDDSDKPWAKKEEALKKEMQAEQNRLKESYIDKKLTIEEYEQAIYTTEMKFMLSKRDLLKQYKQDTSEIQGAIYDKIINMADKAASMQEKKEKESHDKRLNELERNFLQRQKDAKQAFIDGQITSEADFQQQMEMLEIDYLQRRKQVMEEYGEDVTDIQLKIQDKLLAAAKGMKNQANADKEKADSQAEKDYNTRTGDKATNLVIDGLQYIFDFKKKSWETEEEFEERLKNKKITGIKLVAAAAALASEGIQALQQHEIDKVTKRYDKEIAKAKKAGKDTTKLEEEKEAAINQVKKKYADKQFIANVLQITATTAVAAMEAYKAMVSIPVVGPTLAAVAAATTIASGAAQIAVAKAQRDQAKGLKSGGYSDDYVTGYTKSGNPDDVAGVIPVHKNEFVANHEAVANPHVRQFLDVFDVSQRNGSIRMLNTTQILEHVRTRSGRYSGGYTDETSTSAARSSSVDTSANNNDFSRAEMLKMIRTIIEILRVIAAKDLKVNAKDVRDEIKRLEALEKNVTR
jgi:TP901 family phage tail tape measure protein